MKRIMDFLVALVVAYLLFCMLFIVILGIKGLQAMGYNNLEELINDNFFALFTVLPGFLAIAILLIFAVVALIIYAALEVGAAFYRHITG